MSKETSQNNYGIVAKVYDTMSHVYSGGQIRACKAAQIDLIQPGQRVLYAGAGGGEDAVMAAKKGAKVTVVELSETMIEECKLRFRKEGVLRSIEIIHADIMVFQPDSPFDVVVSNFFLNVFNISLMPTVLIHLTALMKSDGYFLISDFRPLEGGNIAQMANFAYYGAVAAFFRVLSNNKFHPIYDYRNYLEEAGLKLESFRDFPLFGVGPAWYRTLVVKKLPA